MLTNREFGWRISGNYLYFPCNISAYLKLCQNRNFNKRNSPEVTSVSEQVLLCPICSIHCHTALHSTLCHGLLLPDSNSLPSRSCAMWDLGPFSISWAWPPLNTGSVVRVNNAKVLLSRNLYYIFNLKFPFYYISPNIKATCAHYKKWLENICRENWKNKKSPYKFTYLVIVTVNISGCISFLDDQVVKG